MTADLRPGRARFHPIRGGRFIHEARTYFQNQRYEPHEDGIPIYRGGIGRAHEETRTAAAQFGLDTLDDPATKRIIIDPAVLSDWAARQPEGGMAEGPVRFPFEQMWIEFPEPVHYDAREPGQEVDDVIIGILISLVGETTYQIGFVYRTDREPFGYADRVFAFDRNIPAASTRITLIRDDLTFGTEHLSEWNDEDAEMVAALPATVLVRVRPPGPGTGYWEAFVYGAQQLVIFLAHYMTARGHMIIEEGPPLSRQQRRARARQRPDHRPQPFHIVYVKLTTVTGAEHGGGAHSYRYDVRGHWRTRVFRLKGGETVTRTSWIVPHQRGPAESGYIPSTHVYARGVAPDIPGADDRRG